MPRHAETVFYEHQDHRVAYTIVSGDPLVPPPHARRIVVAGRELWTFRDGHRDAVISSATATPASSVLSPITLARLATWRGGGTVNF